MKKSKKDRLFTAGLILMLLAGLSLLLYPSVSSYLNSVRQAQSILTYDNEVAALRQEDYQRLRQQAEEYNVSLLDRPSPYGLTDAQQTLYPTTLLAGGSDVMAYLEVPSIGVTLPICHGTETSTLQKAVGHLEWSSLPVGGSSTHCVLSGHRGLPSSELLTNLDHLEYGDAFYLHVLGDTLEYRVDRVTIVEPGDFQLLGIEEGKDYVTLITCTPYGINSHRLLVRGVRVAAGAHDSAALPLINEVRSLDMKYVILAVPLALAVVVFLVLTLDKQKRKKKGESAESLRFRGGGDAGAVLRRGGSGRRKNRLSDRPAQRRGRRGRPGYSDTALPGGRAGRHADAGVLRRRHHPRLPALPAGQPPKRRHAGKAGQRPAADRHGDRHRSAGQRLLHRSDRGRLSGALSAGTGHDVPRLSGARPPHRQRQHHL